MRVPQIYKMPKASEKKEKCKSRNFFNVVATVVVVSSSCNG